MHVTEEGREGAVRNSGYTVLWGKHSLGNRPSKGTRTAVTLNALRGEPAGAERWTLFYPGTALLPGPASTGSLELHVENTGEKDQCQGYLFSLISDMI